jgi:FMN reductase (NADPH)
MAMKSNPVIQTMLEQKSIRKYKKEMPSDEVIETIVRAAQQAPFASQSYSILMSRRRDSHPYKAPLLFTLCVDYHKLELIMARRNWKPVTNDLTLMFFGIQDVSLMAENMVIAGRSLGLGSCFLGFAMYSADRIAKQHGLPKRVFPLVQLVMGYPDEDPPPRPRYPMEFTLFEDKYPEMDEDSISKAMKEMDRGYIIQDYYRKQRAKIPLEKKARKETFTYHSYSWTEHISRKWGQWYPDPKELLDELKKRGFNFAKSRSRDR